MLSGGLIANHLEDLGESSVASEEVEPGVKESTLVEAAASVDTKSNGPEVTSGRGAGCPSTRSRATIFPPTSGLWVVPKLDGGTSNSCNGRVLTIVKLIC